MSPPGDFDATEAIDGVERSIASDSTSRTERRNDDDDAVARFGAGRSRSDHGVPDFVGARQHVLTELVRFASALRSEGVAVPPTGTLEAARSLSVIGLADESRASAALRATLVTEADEREAFDAAFPTFWHRLRTGLERIATANDWTSPDGEDDEGAIDPDQDRSESPRDADFLNDADAPPMDAENSGDEDESVPSVRIATNRREVSGDRSASTEESEVRRYSSVGGSQPVDAEIHPLSRGERTSIRRFVDALATLPGRRSRTSPSGSAVDARRALRSSLGTGGAPIELPATEAIRSELRCCLLVDVSGSVLDTIDRSVLLTFAEYLQESARDARVFLFDTDLVDATAEFARADGDPAATLRDAEVEWGGGTRIGAAIASLRRRHPNAVDRRTVVVVVSDGLDVGDQELLETQITWLASRADSFIWLNPLAASPAFEPRSRGMATSVPYVDALFGFVAPSDLESAARQIERRGLDGPIGYEYDPRRRPTESGGEKSD
ncbi:VWA domain-containing protein [Natrarchaeobius halalkaliphilus]|uniref:VWA domain-containing protein n=1 Tax=Natrarchaeobius halalkaliphilus TaxID=1679091 RepID=A0A3N6MZS1_9EURY|nr:VWA domain-containing protein [Natrarchaeobius halalkaliphilus]RQG91102.1 VWA domain-containing protein [Natrarchaeobius halalkaliphilus]